MILIFDCFDTIIKSKSMDFNRGLYTIWEKYYQDKCTFNEIKELGDALFLHLLEVHKTGKEYSFVKDELPEYAKKFGGKTITMTYEEEADFMLNCDDLIPMPYIPEALAEFQKMEIPMYVLSNSGFTEEALTNVLKRLGIGEYFTHIWSSANYGYIKPNRNFFEMAIETALSEHPEQTREDIIFIGDRYDLDVIGANQANLKIIWLNQKEEKNQENIPVISVSQTRDLLDTVKELVKN